MKKQLLIFILIIFLLTSVIAGGIALSDIVLSSKADTTLKAELPIDKSSSINPTITGIVCNKEVCKSWISYNNLINTEWIQSKDFCSKYETIKRGNMTINGKCLEYTDYTLKELEDLRKAWTEKRLEDFAEYLEERK